MVVVTFADGFMLAAGMSGFLLCGGALVLSTLGLVHWVEATVLERRHARELRAAQTRADDERRVLYLELVRRIHPDLLRGTAGEVRLTEDRMLSDAFLELAPRLERALAWLAADQSLDVLVVDDGNVLDRGVTIRWKTATR